jgi:UDP-3-O-[3-hydroxymyristoyl] glucosamine N-acyltransferase
MPYTTAQIAELIQGQVVGDATAILSGFAPATTAKAGDLTFAENAAYFARAEQSAASAVLIDEDFGPSRKIIIRVPSARIGFAKAMALFFPEPVYSAGVHPSSVVSPSAKVHPTAHIGPHCFVGDNVQIGARSVLQGSDHISNDSVIDEDVCLFPRVTLYPRTQLGKRVRVHAGTVLGSDGFGYVLDGPMHRKVPQIGNVVISDDVEIGANVTIDRGALGPTVIGKGTKIDNLVQIAHNVVVGEHCLVVAQAGIAGSTKLGHYVTLAGQVGIAGHLKIGHKVVVAAQSGVMHDIPEAEKWFGSPAQPDRKWKRQLLALHQLPHLLKRVAELEKAAGINPEEEPAEG